MPQTPLVSVIVPTYNERENITRLIKQIHEIMTEYGIPYEVLVIDDNSPDGTAEAVKSLSGFYSVRIKVRPGKMGLSSAVLEGFKLARGEYLAVMDADLQHPPEVLPSMIRMIMGGCDVVVGSRYVRGGSTPGWSPIRRLVSRVAGFIASILLPRARKVRDTMSGYFVIRRDVIDEVDLNPRGFKILLEILVKGRYSRVCEYPIVFRPRERGESKLGINEIFNYILHVLDLAHEAVRFATVGGLGTLVNISAIALMGYIIKTEHWISVLIAFETSTLFNFLLHELWTFKFGFTGRIVERLAKFHGAVITHFVSQLVLSNFLYYIYGIERITSQLVGIIVGFILNYLLSRYVVWSKRFIKSS